MLFYISKLAYWFLMPISWLFITFIWSYLTKNQKLKKALSLFGIGLLFLLSNPWLSNKTMHAYEYPLCNIDTLKPVELGVILTGVTQRVSTKDGRTFYSKGADRVLHAAELFKKGKVKKLLISGGSGALHPGNEPKECERILHTLLLMGIKRDAIILEENSRNTHENAKFSAEIIEQQNIQQPVILITSAFHLPRAIACFEKENIQVIPVSVDLYSKDIGTEILDFIPREEALSHWAIIIHELIGRISYKILGYS